MDEKTAGQVRKKMETAFEKIAGLKFQIGRGTYDDLIVTFKVTATDNASDKPLAEIQAENAFKTYAAAYGLKQGDLGKEFLIDGAKYRITGINTRRSKFPIAIQEVATGKTMGYTEDGIRLSLAYPTDEKARLKANKDEKRKKIVQTFNMFFGKGLNGVKGSDLGREFQLHGETARIIGAEWDQKKGSRLIVERDNGKAYLVAADEVAKALAA
jgi:hypothetical protein